MHFFRLATAILVTTAFVQAQTTFYVNANLTTGANDGSSWANAFQGEGGLEAASGAALDGDHIFVAEGRYLPTASGLDWVDLHFEEDVQVFGGFLGTESAPDERPTIGEAPTVLHGDLLNDDTSGQFGDNSLQLIGLSPGLVVDGFEFEGAGDNCVTRGMLASNATVRNCTFTRLHATSGAAIKGGAATISGCHFEDCLAAGGAPSSEGGALNLLGTVYVEDSTFHGNKADQGGAIYLSSGQLLLRRCSFAGNRAESAGAFQANAYTEIINCEFFGNLAWIAGVGRTQGEFHMLGCTASGNVSSLGSMVIAVQHGTVRNSVLWGNTTQPCGTTRCVLISGLVNVTYSLVEGGHSGAGNLDVDPLFVDPVGGDLRLGPGSPCVDAGDSTSVSGFDLRGRHRRADDPLAPDTGIGPWPVVDMGAHERTLGSVTQPCDPVPTRPATLRPCLHQARPRLPRTTPPSSSTTFRPISTAST